MEKLKKVKPNVVSLVAPQQDGPAPAVPTADGKSKRKGKERTAETDRSLTNQEVEGNVQEVLSSDELEFLSFVAEVLQANELALSPSPPTKGDGNCWFRAVADQVEFLNIPGKVRNFRAIRLEVCDFLRHLPDDIKQTTIEVVFKGKSGGLSDLASRQRKEGQWVDDTGVMVLATAPYLGRDIHLYSPSTTSATSEVSTTRIEGRGEAGDLDPLTIFFNCRHYQSLQPV